MDKSTNYQYVPRVKVQLLLRYLTQQR